MRHCIVIAVCLFCMLGALAAVPSTERLPNGMRLIVLPTSASQVVSIRLLVDFSALDEPQVYQGVRQVLLYSLQQGSQKRSGSELLGTVSAAGGVWQSTTQRDVIDYAVTLPAAALSTGVWALAELLTQPKLSDEGIQVAISQAQQRLTIKPVGALDTAFQATEERLYADHPYANFGLGSPRSLARMTPDLVRLAYRTFVVPESVVIAVVGRCKPDEVRAQLRAAFAPWGGHGKFRRPLVDPPVLEASQIDLYEAPVKSTCVMMSFPVCGATAKDFLSLRVIDVLLGGGTGSRLFRAVREEQHLAYEVSTYFPCQASSSIFSLYALTDSQYMEQTRTALAKELVGLQTVPVSEGELQRAKAYLKGRYALSHQYSAQHAFDLAWYELIGLGVEYDRTLAARIDAITSEDIQRAAREYFTRYLLAVVIPQTLGRKVEQVTSLGSLTAWVQRK
ncbi:MAG: M16 family metallopeptidase [Armatimonadota bacterium]